MPDTVFFPTPTRGGDGYLGIAELHVPGFDPITIEINVSTRDNRDIRGEVDSITNNFIPTYTLYHLPEEILVEEKVFGALLQRSRPRDFYDLYFIMRSDMLTQSQKDHLAKVYRDIIEKSKNINFQDELRVFLPASQQSIIQDFSGTLGRAMKNQLSIENRTERFRR